MGDTRYERYKKNKKDNFNSLLFKLLNNSFLLKKSLIILNNILFLESFSLKLSSSSKSLLINLIIITNLLRAFIFL